MAGLQELIFAVVPPIEVDIRMVGAWALIALGTYGLLLRWK